MHVLIADNELDTRQLFAMCFDLHGHTTTLVADGLEAVQAVQAQAFDAIILDGGMPEMNGLLATQKIRALPYGQSVPIVVFTAYAYTEQMVQEAGGNALVHKPIMPQTLIQIVEDLVKAQGHRDNPEASSEQ